MTIGEGWGRDAWGKGPWGGAVPPAPLAISNAFAPSTKSVQVALTRPAQVIASTVTGDALNPATWLVQRLDNGFVFSVIAARQEQPDVFVVTLLQALGSEKVTHRILSATLRDEVGDPIGAPNRWDFAGLLDASARDATTVTRRRRGGIEDVANPPTPQLLPTPAIGGTLVITAGGDYARESGAPLLRKLILRRLVTTRGSFFHLPEYGIGLREKGLLPAADLIRLRVDILRQVQLEPEVESVAVQIIGVENSLTVSIRAKMRSEADPVGLALKLTPEGVSL